jgi:ankyrin repeat protein
LWRAVFSSGGSTETVEVLLRAGADPSLANASGVSPRALAERMGAQDVLEQMSLSGPG